jgi:IclR family transcriptional regulator, KDG regulon repressor
MPGSNLVQSIVRGLDLLECVARSENGLTLKQMSGGLRLKPPTAHNLVRTLVVKGYLEKSLSGTVYQLGPAAMELSQSVWLRKMMQKAEGEVQSLFGLLAGATVVFSEHFGGQMMLRLRMSSERPGTVQRPSDTPMSPYGSASGLVYQAFCGNEQLDNFRQRFPLSEFGGHLWKSEKDLNEYLISTRLNGVVVLDRPSLSNFPVAAPVFDKGMNFAAAIGASIASANLATSEKDRMIRAVVEASKRLSN